MLHVTLQGPDWIWDKDPRTSSDGYDSAYRNFIGNGVAICTRESVESIVQNFDTRFIFRERPSDIPNAVQISIYDKSSLLEVLKIARYKWADFIDYFVNQHEFEIVFEKSIYSDDGILGDGVVLLRWRDR